MISLPDYKSIVYGNKVAGVSIFYSEDKKCSCTGLLLKKVKGNVIVEKEFIEKGSIEELVKEIPQKTPVSINISGKGLLIRKVKKQNEYDPVQLIRSLIPNASPEDFYIKVYDFETNSFVALIRTEQVKSLIEGFTANNLFVTEINLGPFSLSNILGQLSAFDSIVCPGYRINIENNSIKDYQLCSEHLDFQYQIGEEKFSSESILSFATGLDFFIEENKDQKNAEIEGSRISYRFHRKGKVFGMAGLVLLFSILLINFLMFDSYNKKVNMIQQKVAMNRTLVNQHDSLKSEFLRKKAFSEKFGNTGSSTFSLYLDRLASKVPNEVILDKVFINPIRKHSGNNKKLEFENNKIIIEGRTKSSLDINQYIKDIKSFSWVKEVEVINFKNEKTNKTAQFILEIITNV
jgi:hypothetical protein